MSVNALVIEDHPGQGIIFRTALEQLGYQVQWIQDGKTAESALNEQTPEIILLDLHLPGLGGDKLLERIHNDPRFAKTQVILTTADGTMADMLSSKVDLVLLKPIGFDQLKGLVGKIAKQQK
ncbi:MAG: response regulator [Phototrophicaceae bacterium]|jgi:CheY-like chemotaxis protein